MGDKADRQIEALRMFDITATKGWRDKINIGGEDSFLGRGVSLTTADGDIKLSLTGWWATLEDATEHAQALNRGIAILEAPKDAETEN